MAAFADAFERQFHHQQQIGGSLNTSEHGRFEFSLNPYTDRRSERMGVRERQYTANIRQVGRFIPQQNLSATLTDGLHRTVQNLIRRENISDQDRVYFGLTSNRLNSSYNYRGLPASEWINGSDRVNEMLAQMASMLNSNENFEMNDTFQLSFTHVLGVPSGTGRKRKLKPGHTNPETFKRMKTSVININNDDNLCCARSIVTAKANEDKHPNWQCFRKGRKIQKEQALLLHHEANVPFGPCGYEELVKFTMAPSLYGYQLLLVDATRGYSVTSFGPPQEKQIVLLYDNQHYDVIRALPGFFGTSYFCARCLKSYNDKGNMHVLTIPNIARHACKQDAPITQNPSVAINLQLYPADFANACSTEMYACKII